MRRKHFPYTYDLDSRFPERRLVFAYEGGGVETAEADGKAYIIVDEGTMADFLLPDDPLDADVLAQLITVLEFDSPAERDAHAVELADFGLHALAYTAVLFLAGIFGERPKSAMKVVLATQRALEQQALERWKMQKEAQIEAMMREGQPLGAVAAALGSPETAERIALMEAATSGAMSALDAATLTLRRAGHDTAVFDGLSGGVTAVDGSPGPGASVPSAARVAEELLAPFGLGRRA